MLRNLSSLFAPRNETFQRIVEMRVHMDCPGCETKIRKALRKLDGVDNVDIDMNLQKVMVTGWMDQEKVLQTVRKTGRLVELWPYPYNPEYHAFNYTYYNQFYRNPATRFAVNPVTYYDSEPVTSVPNPVDDDYYDDDIFSPKNYHVHGYNSHDDHGTYQEAPFTTVFSEKTSAMFSDENVHGCSIM